MILESVQHIAVKDQLQRREAIKNILNQRSIPYKIQHTIQGKHEIENIVITFGETEKYLVLGAHYDSVAGSTGANDNASGVSILIELAARLQACNASGIEIVFFDREETDDHGSHAYIRLREKEKISAMVNLDMCGFGEIMCMITKSNIDNPVFSSCSQKKCLNVIAFFA